MSFVGLRTKQKEFSPEDLDNDFKYQNLFEVRILLFNLFIDFDFFNLFIGSSLTSLLTSSSSLTSLLTFIDFEVLSLLLNLSVDFR